MKFSESLKKSIDFKNVYNKGVSHADRLLVMYALANGTERNRFGISVSKKVGNSVVRHRLTRLIREAYRLHEEMYQNGFDIVVIARVNAKGAAYQKIEQSLLSLASLHSIMVNEKKMESF